ncbi:MAG: D-aminoacylase [Xanthomonadales bacterium]|mgnify:CR=1 FL=1|nr:D-aminoacylase [Xanthomonadales bacterium]
MMSVRHVCRSAFAAVALLMLAPAASATPAYDTIVRNGHIIDGTGSPWYAADVAIKDGRIAAIGHFAPGQATNVIDAHGMVVAPGFIDMLGQSETSILVDPRLPSKVFQGITTEITGEGESVAPLNAAIIEQRQPGYDHFHIHPDWRNFQEYFARLRKQGMGINLGTYVGAASVREMVIGYGDRAPTPAELRQMQGLVEDAMRQGAFGLSTALQYPPATYAQTPELVALAQSAARHGGIYATHMRSEGNAEIAALDETFRIGREAGIGVEIFHLKVSGKPNWGTMPKVVARIEAARASGIDVAADAYPYTAWQNNFSSFIPPWAHDGGDSKLLERLKDPATRARIRKDMQTPSDAWDNTWLAINGPQDILISSVSNPELQKYVGQRVSSIAAEWHTDPLDTVFDFLVRDHAATDVVVFGMQDADVDLALRQPWVSFDTDYHGTAPDGLLGRDHSHPRAYGTFPRILARYVRERKLLTLPDAIRKFTALPAQRMGLADRGVLKRGMWADLVVFDPDTVHDVATYEDPNRLAMGMRYVLVNGVPVIAGGQLTGALPGQVLLGPGYAGAGHR